MRRFSYHRREGRRNPEGRKKRSSIERDDTLGKEQRDERTSRCLRSYHELNDRERKRERREERDREKKEKHTLYTEPPCGYLLSISASLKALHLNEADCLFCTLCVRREDVVAEILEESAEVMLNAILLRVVCFCVRVRVSVQTRILVENK